MNGQINTNETWEYRQRNTANILLNAYTTKEFNLLIDMILHLERKFLSPTETFIANQINALKNHRHEVFTIEHLNALQTDATAHHPPQKLPLETKVLRMSHKAYFQKRIKELDVDLIHAHYLTDAAFYHSFTKGISLPKICSCYGYDVSAFPKKYGIIARMLFKRVFDEYDFFLAMSNDMKNDLIDLGCPEQKVKVHYHGIHTRNFDLNREYGSKRDVLTILTIASLEARKGHINVLEAITQIRNQHPEVDLAYSIVGNGYLKHSLERFVADNQLEDIVTFVPATKHGDEFNKLLLNADIFIHPSVKLKSGDKEGIPGAIVEAMTSGLPVISTFHAGIPTVIEDGVTGFLVPENDSEGIAKRILHLYKEVETANQVGKNAKKYALKNLDLFKKAEDLEEIYKNAISNRGNVG